MVKNLRDDISRDVILEVDFPEVDFSKFIPLPAFPAPGIFPQPLCAFNNNGNAAC